MWPISECLCTGYMFDLSFVVGCNNDSIIKCLNITYLCLLVACHCGSFIIKRVILFGGLLMV